MGAKGVRILTDKQYDLLCNEPRENIYVTYGNMTRKWYIYFSKADKYQGGYESKEEANKVIQSGEYLNRELVWYNGNTFAI